MIQKIRNFFSDVVLEGKRISWPNRRELVDSTIVVIVFIVLLAIVILACDKIIGQLLALLFNTQA